MTSLRAVGVVAASISFGIAASACSDHKAPEAVVTPRTQVEVRLTATEGANALPPLQIQVYFDAAVDPHAHVQPLTAAIAAARGKCAGKLGPTAVMKLKAHQGHLGVVSGDGGCLASQLDAAAIDDAADLVVDLVVRVGV